MVFGRTLAISDGGCCIWSRMISLGDDYQGDSITFFEGKYRTVASRLSKLEARIEEESGFFAMFACIWQRRSEWPIFQISVGPMVKDLPNNKTSTSVPKSTLLLSTELGRKTPQNGIIWWFYLKLRCQWVWNKWSRMRVLLVYCGMFLLKRQACRLWLSKRSSDLQ